MANTDDTTQRFRNEPDGFKEILQNVVAELGQLRESVEARNRETRPLGETLEAMRVDIKQVKDGQDELRKEVRAGFALMERKQNLLNNCLLDSEGDIVGLDQRVEALEGRQSST